MVTMIVGLVVIFVVWGIWVWVLTKREVDRKKLISELEKILTVRRIDYGEFLQLTKKLFGDAAHHRGKEFVHLKDLTDEELRKFVKAYSLTKR